MADKNTRQPVDDRRKEVYLEVLRKTGSKAAAAAAASPHADPNARRPGFASFRDLIRKDPEFAEQVADAKQFALGLVERTIAERALTPERRPIFVKGELVDWVEDRRSADKLLLAVARRLDPGAWSEKSEVKVDGQVRHEHAHMFALEARHVLLLDDGDRETLVALLGKMGDKLEETNDGRRALPASIDA